MTESNLYYRGEESFSRLVKIVSQEKFWQRHGWGVETFCFICPYRPADGLQIEDPAGGVIPRLMRELLQSEVPAVAVDVYDTAVDLLRQAGVMDTLTATEARRDADLGADERRARRADRQVYETLQGWWDPGNQRQDLEAGAADNVVDAVLDKIAATSRAQVVLLGGLGACYPFVRTHAFIEEYLSRGGRDYATVVFYPGSYERNARGMVLNFCDDSQVAHHYRSVNIFSLE